MNAAVKTKPQAKSSLPTQNPDGSRTGEFVPVSLDDERSRQHAADTLRNDESLRDFLNSLCDAVAQSDYADKISRRRKTVKLRNYICGNYLGYVDDNGVWQDKSSDKGADSLYYDPETATYIDVLVASIVKSKPVWNIVAANPEDIAKREAARVGQLLFDESLKQLAPAKKIQREVKLNLIAAGETYRFTYFNSNKPNCGYYETKFEPKITQEQKSYSVCLDCGTSTNQDAQEPQETQNSNEEPKQQTIPQGVDIAYNETPKENGQAVCQNCGSQNTTGFSRQAVVLNVRQGEEFVNVGDVESDFVDPLEMTVIGDVDDIASALAVQRTRMLHRCLLEEAYGDFDLPSTGTPDELAYQNQGGDNNQTSADVNSAAGDTRPKGNKNQFEKLALQITWFAPAAYASYRLDKDTPLKNGKILKKGTPLKKVFPSGLCVTRIQKRIVNLYGQNAGECWTHSVNSVSEGFHGIGEWDLSALQDQLNNVSSMKMNSLMHDSTSPLIYRSKYVKAAQLKNKVGLTVPVSEDFEDNRNLSEIATRLPGSGGVPEAYELAQDLRQRMVNRTGAMTQAGGGIGEAEAATKTATGYRLWYEHTLGRRAPMLTLRAEMIAEQGYQILEMKQKYLCEKALSSAEKEVSSEAIKWFMDCNVRSDLRVEIAPDSWMPQSEIQKKADFAEFMSLIAPLIQMKPELVDKIIERISENYSDFDLTEHAADTTEGQIRLEKLLEIAEFAETQSNQRGIAVTIEQSSQDGVTSNLLPNPLLIDLVMKQAARDLKVVHAAENDPFADFPMDVMFDDHTELENTYTDYLKSATGRRASLFVRACVRRAAYLHRKARFEFQRQMSELANAAQAPDLEASMIASDEQHKQLLAQNEDTHQQELRHAGEQQLQSAAISGLGQAIEADATEGQPQE